MILLKTYILVYIFQYLVEPLTVPDSLSLKDKPKRGKYIKVNWIWYCFAGKKCERGIPYVLEHMSSSGKPNNPNRGTIDDSVPHLWHCQLIQVCWGLLCAYCLNRKQFLYLFSIFKNQSTVLSSYWGTRVKSLQPGLDLIITLSWSYWLSWSHYHCFLELLTEII